MTTREKLQIIIDRFCNGQKTVMADRLGHEHSSTVGSWVSRGKWDIEQIATAFPEIALEWLVYGKGPITKAEYRAADIPCADDIDPDEHQSLDIPSSDGQPLLAVSSHDGQPSLSASSSSRPYDITGSSSCLQVSEGEAVDRALLNLLLREKSALEARLASKSQELESLRASKDQELELLRQRNLELEKKNAVMSDRLDNAEKWYRQTFHKD